MKTAIGVAVFAVALGAGLGSHVVSAQAVAAGAAAGRTPNVEFEMMTWPEVKKAMADGKTTALVDNGGAELPGTIGLTNEIFEAINEQVAEEPIKTGFTNVVLMSDHGGGQAQLEAVATKLDAK